MKAKNNNNKLFEFALLIVSALIIGMVLSTYCDLDQELYRQYKQEKSQVENGFKNRSFGDMQ